MNQLDFINSPPPSKPYLPLQDTRSPQLSQLLNHTQVIQSANFTTRNQAILALIQVCYQLNRELQIQLQKNKMLLSSMYCHNLHNVGMVKKQAEREQDLIKYSLNSQQQDQQPQGQTKQRKLTVNDTKNISKNFGKAIINFIQKNPQKITKILKRHNLNTTEFSSLLKQKKKKVVSIKELRSLWLDSQFEYARPFRQISYMFLRKASLQYIFKSRITDYPGHLKYRRRIVQALHNPEQFHSIKQ